MAYDNGSERNDSFATDPFPTALKILVAGDSAWARRPWWARSARSNR